MALSLLRYYNTIDLPDPVETIEFRMEQAGLTPKDLVPAIDRLNRVPLVQIFECETLWFHRYPPFPGGSLANMAGGNLIWMTHNASESRYLN